MSQKNAKVSRRNFLLTVGAGGAATAAVVITGKQVLPEAKTDSRGSRGYQVSEHINNYYRTTKV